MVYETLGKVSDLQIQEGANKNEVRLSGVFGVCGVRNNNRRVYNKENYGMMVEALQHVIETEGCPGELEHPNSMNITLENVSHKIESIEMQPDGTIVGTILLLNTPKGQIAKAIVEGGLPLYISSRGAGSIDANGNVTLSTIKTYDLVGTPGFSQAKLSLKENQTYESLNESLEDGNIMYAIVENDEFGNDTNDDKKPTDIDNNDKQENDDDKTDEKTKSTNDISMEELKSAIDKLVEKVESLEAELHIAKESLSVDYNTIEKWVVEEFAPEFKHNTMCEMGEIVEKWVVEEFAPEVQNWVVEEFAPEVQNWVVEEFAPEVQNWVVEEFAPEVQNWVVEEFAPEVENWLNEQYMPEQSSILENKINNNINEFFESQKASKYDNIDKMLESLENVQNNDEALKILTENQKANSLFNGYFAVENMPTQYRPLWESLSEERQVEIARQSRMYDFTKPGILESFWSGINFENNQTPINEKKFIGSDYHLNIIKQMNKLRT